MEHGWLLLTVSAHTKPSFLARFKIFFIIFYSLINVLISFCSILWHSVPGPRRSCIQQFSTIWIMRLSNNIRLKPDAMCSVQNQNSFCIHDDWHNWVSFALSLFSSSLPLNFTFLIFFSFLLLHQLWHFRIYENRWMQIKRQTINAVQTSQQRHRYLNLFDPTKY